MRCSWRVLVAAVAGVALAASACGSDDAGSLGAGADGSRPTVVVTTNILGDVVENLVGDAFDVVTIMPVGADPHDFQASAQQVAAIGAADAFIVNGGKFEEGLLDVIEAAEGDGVPVFRALSAVETIEFGQGGHGHHEEGHEEDDEHGDEEHSDEEHSDEEHEHDGVDPHFWTDPARMAVAADAISEFLIANVDGIDADAIGGTADSYVADLEALDREAAETLAAIDEGSRVLITNHDALGYFASRYDFEVAGTVIPSGSTTDGTSAEQLAELTALIEDEGVPAIFAETTSSDELAQTLAAEVGSDVAVVELYTGSLGESGSDAETYVAMVRANVQRIVDALAG